MNHLILALILSAISGNLFAATVFTDRAVFQGVLGDYLVDTYETYPRGGPYTDAEMNAFFGETKYFPTGHSVETSGHFREQSRITTARLVSGAVTQVYCAGCNGSFEISWANAIKGVGFNVFYNLSGSHVWPIPDDSIGYHAFVTFADNSTADFPLPLEVQTSPDHVVPPYFWGITSTMIGIKSVHIGLENGVADPTVSFVMDDLTIGAAVPVPAASWLFGSALGLLGWMRRNTA